MRLLSSDGMKQAEANHLYRTNLESITEIPPCGQVDQIAYSPKLDYPWDARVGKLPPVRVTAPIQQCVQTDLRQRLESG
jgi:hypothetical protein